MPEDDLVINGKQLHVEFDLHPVTSGRPTSTPTTTSTSPQVDSVEESTRAPPVPSNAPAAPAVCSTAASRTHTSAVLPVVNEAVEDVAPHGSEAGAGGDSEASAGGSRPLSVSAESLQPDRLRPDDDDTSAADNLSTCSTPRAAEANPTGEVSVAGPSHLDGPTPGGLITDFFTPIKDPDADRLAQLRCEVAGHFGGAFAIDVGTGADIPVFTAFIQGCEVTVCKHGQETCSDCNVDYYPANAAIIAATNADHLVEGDADVSAMDTSASFDASNTSTVLASITSELSTGLGALHQGARIRAVIDDGVQNRDRSEIPTVLGTHHITHRGLL